MSFSRARAAFQRWLFRVKGPEAAPITLGQRRIFVLPTTFGLALGATLAVMLLASINYTLSLGYALTFLIGSVAWVSIHHAFRNLVELRIEPGRVEPVFCGAPLHFGIVLNNPGGRPRTGLQLRPTHGGKPVEELLFDVPAAGRILQDVAIATTERGWLQLPRLTLETCHPLGLIRAWSLFQPDMRGLVYPTPESGAPALPHGAGDRPGGGTHGNGMDDFAGLRHHQPADSPRHVAWKAVARGGPWLTKTFDGNQRGSIWLDWQALPAGLETEARLSRLTSWVIDAERSGLDYGLRIPGTLLQCAHGTAHRHACLSALALYGRAHG
ncbi:DUF58 domain-containing protein [Zoogloea sp.]|uniref:DUF58 domain-containing protein n=1 Tax=Zoogloea sp. TaxID=49181 RepID=UPI0035AEEFEA